MNEVVQMQQTPEQSISKLLVNREKAFKNVQSVPDMDFLRECTFAKQQILKNDFATNMAMNNQQSLQNAITNVGAIGLTLNPASAYAYLVPRDRAIMLDISYRGLCKLATDTGVIKWVRAEMVYSEDTFQLQGLSAQPVHEFDPFATATDRGTFKGVYCVAKTADGDYLTDVMSADEVYKIRDLSQAYKSAENNSKRNSVWHLWFDQMSIKSVLKRASKLWPVSSGSDRLHAAVNLLNDQEGSEPIDQPQPARGPVYTVEQKKQFDEALYAENDAGAAMIWHMSRRLSTGVWTDLYNSGEKGQVTKIKKLVDELSKKGIAEIQSVAAELANLKDSNDEMGAVQILEEYEGMLETIIEQIENPELEAWINEVKS